MFKEFLMKKAISSQLKDVPQETKDKILAAVDKDPDFFTKIAMEVKTATDAGVDQMTAMRDVMQKHQAKIVELMK